THGGPIRQMLLGFHYMQYYHNAYAQNQYLASKGYTVLSVNYRLGIMYGRAFREPPNSVWRGASEYQDVVAGAKFLQTLENVDPNGSDSGADRTAGSSPRWAWRATPTFSKPASISTECTTGRISCRCGPRIPTLRRT